VEIEADSSSEEDIEVKAKSSGKSKKTPSKKAVKGAFSFEFDDGQVQF
jgi:hypothetical protein